MRGVIHICMTSAATDTENRICARNLPMLSSPPMPFRGHVELQVDDRGGERAEADHQRDDLHLFRLPQQFEGPASV